MRILVAYGTRPEYIKIQPLLKQFRRNRVSYKSVRIRQHTDLLPVDSDQTIEVFEDKIYPLNRLDTIVRSILSSFHVFDDITHVLVQGDTTAAFGMALASFHKGVPVMHLEAGLRTNDKASPFPEEVNRRMISSLASIHFCPRAQDKMNLVKEGYIGDKIYITGNTVIDNIKDMPSIPKSNNEVLITMHRRENHKDMKEWFSAISKLARKHKAYDFVFPMHPNPNVQAYRNLLKGVKVCEPFDYTEMKVRLAACSCVISDSGGIQEECNYFKKRCYVCRTSTERSCLTNVMCSSPAELVKRFDPAKSCNITEPCEFGDGNAAEKITKIIQEL
jgi:UDP-N-acetylglucosamine 2-epimerase (non-hydrolysing)